MKKYILLIFLFGNSVAPAQFIEWGVQFGPDYRGLWVKGMVADTNGNTYVLGIDRTGMATLETFLRKYNSSGILQWSTPIGSTSCLDNPLEISSLTYGADGHLYLIGNTSCNYLETGSLTLNLNAGASIGQYIARLDINGVALLLKNSPDNLIDIGADAAGNYFVTGPNGTRKYNAAGNLLWLNTTAKGKAITVSGDGKSYVTGSNGTFKIQPTGNIAWQTNAHSGDHIAYSSITNHVFIITPQGLSKLRFSATSPLVYFNPDHGGKKVFCDSTGSIYACGNDRVKRLNTNGFVNKEVETEFSVDYAITPNGQTFVTGNFENYTNQFRSCVFSTPLEDISTCGLLCGEDSYLIKLNYTAAPVKTIYNYPKVCLNQPTLVEVCTDRVFHPNNEFQVYISDATGSFANPVYVGVTPYVYLSDTLPPGSKYRFKVVSTNPVVNGIPSAKFSLKPDPGPLNIVAVGQANLCDSGYVRLRARDSLGNALNCDWFGDSFFDFNFRYKETTQTFTATQEGNYYASSKICFSQSAIYQATVNCRIGNNEINNVQVYPNPSATSFHIISENLSDLQIFDLSGRLIESIAAVPAEFETGSSWNPGIYILKAYSEGKPVTLKLIRQ